MGCVTGGEQAPPARRRAGREPVLGAPHRWMVGAEARAVRRRQGASRTPQWLTQAEHHRGQTPFDRQRCRVLGTGRGHDDLVRASKQLRASVRLPSRRAMVARSTISGARRWSSGPSRNSPLASASSIRVRAAVRSPASASSRAWTRACARLSTSACTYPSCCGNGCWWYGWPETLCGAAPIPDMSVMMSADVFAALPSTGAPVDIARMAGSRWGRIDGRQRVVCRLVHCAHRRVLDRAHVGRIANVAFEWLPAIRVAAVIVSRAVGRRRESPAKAERTSQPGLTNDPRRLWRTSTSRRDATTATTAEGAPTTADEATLDMTERGATMTQGGMERGTTRRPEVESRRKSRGLAGRASHLVVRVDPPRGQSRLAIRGAGPTDRSVGTSRARPCIPTRSILCRRNGGLRSRGPA